MESGDGESGPDYASHGEGDDVAEVGLFLRNETE